jgi:hypothetical protein
VIVTLVIGGFVKGSVKAMPGKYIHLLQVELLNRKLEVQTLCSLYLAFKLKVIAIKSLGVK